MIIDRSYFCLTSDIDWTSDYCIKDLLQFADSFGITPTFFATHDSTAVKEFMEKNENAVGLHPNFYQNSTHGKDYLSVIDHVFKLYPRAKSFRSHLFYDSSPILTEMSNRGIKYDSNLCLYLQPNITPLRLAIPNLTRFPIFWEDDAHWMNTGGDWDTKNFLDAFEIPGIKILNIHPFIFSANVPNEDYYLRIKKHSGNISEDNINQFRYDGDGARTFLISLINYLTAKGEEFYTLDQLYKMFPLDNNVVSNDETSGRVTRHAEKDHKKYWQMTDTEKQHFLKKDYEERNAQDKYATSRDFNLRELEIQAISKCIEEEGPILDIGCGNGYTLISLAKRLEAWKLTGVDFSGNLIKGAKHLISQEKDKLKSMPSFICSDALKYLSDQKDESIKYIITERFILNLPSMESQKNALREIYRVLQKRGRLLMCEGTISGFKALNDIRVMVGLEAIQETSADNISANRIDDKVFKEYLSSELGFKLQDIFGFSNYFIISRVLHPLMVSPLKPRFDSKYNEIAKLIQENLDLEPGYGSNVLWLLEK